MVLAVQKSIPTKPQMLEHLRTRGGFLLPVDRGKVERLVTTVMPYFGEDESVERISLDPQTGSIQNHSTLYSGTIKKKGLDTEFLRFLEYLQNKLLNPAFKSLLTDQDYLITRVNVRRQRFNLNRGKQSAQYLLKPHIDYHLDTKRRMFTFFSEAFYLLPNNSQDFIVANNLSVHDLQHKHLGRGFQEGKLPERHPKSQHPGGIPIFGNDNLGNKIAVIPQGTQYWRIGRDVFKPGYHSLDCSSGLTRRLMQHTNVTQDKAPKVHVDRFTIIGSGYLY